MSTLKVGGLTHREVLKNAERLEIEAAARRAGAEQMRERAARETDYAVAYHPPLSGSIRYGRKGDGQPDSRRHPRAAGGVTASDHDTHLFVQSVSRATNVGSSDRLEMGTGSHERARDQGGREKRRNTHLLQMLRRSRGHSAEGCVWLTPTTPP